MESGSNSALLWTYVIDANMALVPNKGLYRAPGKVESAKNAGFTILPPWKLKVNGEKAIYSISKCSIIPLSGQFLSNLSGKKRVEFGRLLYVASYRQKVKAPTQVYSIYNFVYFHTSGILPSILQGKWLKLGFTLDIRN